MKLSFYFSLASMVTAVLFLSMITATNLVLENKAFALKLFEGHPSNIHSNYDVFGSEKKQYFLFSIQE